MADTPEQQLAKLRAQRVKLRVAMASGVLTVEGADNTGRVTYRSYDEMKKALRDLDRDIAALVVATGGTVVRRASQVVMTGRSGW
ncbi:hypothetical protein SAMN04487843_108220 [Methylobacterium sp. ap11]|uniref:phage head-tail joining protein n=1 Tax=Methylobacterium sp. ap11 TaxID=1761799 RepID=UPI0008D6263B|nr:hypothetical protein [Methylobacterium sp. ap11]SEP21563.1 hypothetical protein SAMN04487843_108220 [Methylobacterium sp. ap11]